MTPEPARRGTLWLALPWSPALPAGVSIVVSRLAGAFAAQGVAHAVVITDWSATTLRVDADGYRHLNFGIGGTTTFAATCRAVVQLPLRLWRLRRTLRRGHVDAVDFHYVGLDALGVALLKRLGGWRGRLVLSFHGTDVRTPASAMERRSWQFLLASADALTACSAALAATLVATHGDVCRRTLVIHNGVDVAVFKPTAPSPSPSPTASPPLSISPTPRYFVSVGSYIPRKGHLTLLRAFVRLAAEHPDLGLVLCGQDGPERTALLALAASEGLASRVDCRVDLRPVEVAAAIAGAVGSVQPSLAEPFGIAVIEAGACGVPVIASAVGGHVEVLADSTDGALGLLFGPGDVAQCEAAMRQVLDRPAEAAERAQRFRRAVVARYTWDACAAGYAAANGLSA